MSARWLALLLMALLSVPMAAPADPGKAPPGLRVITTNFVLPAKFAPMREWAAEAGLTLETVELGASSGQPSDWLADAALVVLDTPRPSDRARVEQALGAALGDTRTPWLRVGGGAPGAGNLAPEHARALAAYYANGGETNYRRMFDYIVRWQAGADPHAVPAAEPLPTTGFYHPAAAGVFDDLDAYLAWGAPRWQEAVGRIAFVAHSGIVTDLRTDVVDALVDASEAAGLVPIVFWYDSADPQGLSRILRPAGADVLVNLTHLQNGEARRREFLELDIPVLQTLNYRDGTPAEWGAASSGVPAHTAATFLAVPETWGMSDPLLISAVADGAAVPLPAQVTALVAKAKRLIALRRTAPADKRLALMFWNYPSGEKNFSASHLNVPRSLERLGAALAAAGYRVEPAAEAELIAAGQAMLGALYQPQRLDALHARGLAGTLPLAHYQAWLNGLPAAIRQTLQQRWGDPARHPAVREIDGEPQFLIPRLPMGNLIVMPQLPRGGAPGEGYHDTALPPDHWYLAAYLFVRTGFQAHALVHFGTHGSQEWLPGKDRGLAVDDYPLLALGELPVFYPYIQDNVAEAIQAKRRGRAVIISHQTPPFAPAGLYEELRDLHALLHEYTQLDAGAVRERTAARIRAAAADGGMQADLGWDTAAMEAEFERFLSELHDHLHTLAAAVMPLGLHSFGEPAAPEHRLSTVMQQLGEPFYARVAAEPDELFVDDFSQLQASVPYRLLQRHLREGASTDAVTDPQLRELLQRAAGYEARLAAPGEIEALLAALEGRFVAPGSGGDPIRNPELESGRNLYAFEPDKIPTEAAYQAGEAALTQLIEAYCADHDGAYPRKLAFSLWSSETIRQLGVLEAQLLRALGLRPVWNAGGRLTALEIVPTEQLGRPRIDVVVQVTSVYRDQFDGFMRLLAGAIEELAARDEPGNPIAANSAAVARELEAAGLPAGEARRLAALRLFGNAPGDYGTGLPDAALDSTAWDDEATLAEAFLERMRYGFASDGWGIDAEAANLLTSQLRGVDAAVMSRSSNLHGLLSTDHPFEFLGGLSLAIRHLDGESPALYIADLRQSRGRVTRVERFLSEELRSRYLNPHWIGAMQQEGYAGTLQILNAVNNLWGWQVTDPSSVRADQWQAVHDTFIEDSRELGLDAWFEAHNPSAQAQTIERLIEAIRKDYWDAPEATRRALVERWQQLETQHDVRIGAAATREFVAELAHGFGLAAGVAPSAVEATTEGTAETIQGRLLEPVAATDALPDWSRLFGLFALAVLLLIGAIAQQRANHKLTKAETAK